MSMISDLVERLRSLARVSTDDTSSLLMVAAYTIENLCAIARMNNLSEVVRCKDCKYRPHLEDENGSDYGFNVSGDEMCPCVNKDDGWYSWMPKDNFYCGFGERKGGEDE